MIEVQNLSKYYGSHVGVDGISLAIRTGEIFSLLGPNGAGKTTTLECLEGLRRPDSGTIQIAGVDPWREPARLRSTIGVQLQSGGLPDSITPLEALQIFCAYHDAPVRMDLLERIGLSGQIHKPYSELSAGQQRRLTLSLAIAHNPRVVFLDEPSAGLDVATRVELHEIIMELKAAGTTVLLATHDMAEAEALSDRVAILLRGKIVMLGAPLEITAAGAELTKISVRTRRADLDQIGLPAAQAAGSKDGYRMYFSSDIRTSISALLAHIDDNGDHLIDLRVERPSLEDRFLEITGGKTPMEGNENESLSLSPCI